jgi:hypothetical protein
VSHVVADLRVPKRLADESKCRAAHASPRPSDGVCGGQGKGCRAAHGSRHAVGAGSARPCASAQRHNPRSRTFEDTLVAALTAVASRSETGVRARCWDRSHGCCALRPVRLKSVFTSKTRALRRSSNENLLLLSCFNCRKRNSSFLLLLLPESRRMAPAGSEGVWRCSSSTPGRFEETSSRLSVDSVNSGAGLAALNWC